MKQRIRLTPTTRQIAIEALKAANDGDYLEIRSPNRTLDQNALLHALFSDVSKQATWQGRKLNAHQWKTLFISAHAVASGLTADVIAGLENEVVNIRESSASMSIARMTSLIEYILAWCAEKGVQSSEPIDVPGWVRD